MLVEVSFVPDKAEEFNLGSELIDSAELLLSPDDLDFIDCRLNRPRDVWP